MKVKKTNKFYKIYNTFSDSEKKEFCEFLRLSFVKKPRLTKTIISEIESGRDLHDYLCTIYSERSLWNIYSELTRSVEYFLAVKEIFEDEKAFLKLKGNQFRKRGLKKLVKKDFTKEINDHICSDFYIYKFGNIKRSAYDFVQELVKDGITKSFNEAYKLSSDFRILEFVYEVLSFKIEDNIRNEFYGNKTDLLSNDILNFINTDEVIKIICKKYPEYNFCFRYLINMYRSSKGPDNYYYFIEAKNEFLQNLDSFSLHYRMEIFLNFINYCFLLSNKTGKNMNAEMLELLKAKLDNGLTEDLKNSNIGENHFRDYVYIALNEGDIPWAEEFLEKYTPLLPEEIKENNINTAHAFINLHKKNFSEAINDILKLNRKYYINDFDYYTVQIFAYFETGNFIECIRLKNRFKEYADNNSQLNHSYKTGINNFLKILSDLIRFKETGRKNILDDLEYKIKNTEVLSWRTWLTSMINEA